MHVRSRLHGGRRELYAHPRCQLYRRGGRHTCALLSNGAVRCWGYGLNGELGYGNSKDIGDNETPASAGDVNVGGPVQQLALGEFHTCALLTTGKVRCWGSNGTGQ